MDPALDEINPSQSSSSFSSTVVTTWKAHITLICDNHERKWIPNRLPEACFTCRIIYRQNVKNPLNIFNCVREPKGP
ncbi:unnamed protein product, partial [Schistosoma intercalatum]